MCHRDNHSTVCMCITDVCKQNPHYKFYSHSLSFCSALKAEFEQENEWQHVVNFTESYNFICCCSFVSFFCWKQFFLNIVNVILISCWQLNRHLGCDSGTTRSNMLPGSSTDIRITVQCGGAAWLFSCFLPRLECHWAHRCSDGCCTCQWGQTSLS